VNAGPGGIIVPSEGRLVLGREDLSSLGRQAMQNWRWNRQLLEAKGGRGEEIDEVGNRYCGRVVVVDTERFR